ncbi:MAG: substrate-binding domain-containing protein [Chitinophagaceae bacterium]
MEPILTFEDEKKTPKYLQVVNAVISAINKGKLNRGDQLSSINELSNEFFLARDTVQKAYGILLKKGVLCSVRGKGYYINRTDLHTSYKILLVFNKISNYKKEVYNSFVQAIGDKGTVDLKIHNFNSKFFESLIVNHLNDYDYFVVMPHFYDNHETVQKTFLKIPDAKLVILDKDINDRFTNYSAVFQDFRLDVMEALEQGIESIKKYNKLIFVQPKVIPYPPEIALGFINFCNQYQVPYEIIHEVEYSRQLNKKEAYLVIEETDLVNLINACKQNQYKIGTDVGIISFNDTPLKAILHDGITVISTDHAKMGETAARLILENRREKIKNPFHFILRNSL